MLIYILVVIFPLIIESLYKRRVLENNLLNNEEYLNKKRLKYLFVAALPMFFLIAFRNQRIGADTNGYLENFERIIKTPWDELYREKMEYGYLAFVKLLTYVTHNPLIFQIVYTSIYYFALISFVKELEEGHFLLLFLFGTLGMYTFMFTGVRQCLAISLCLFSYKYIKKRKILPFAILMFLAFYFHKSSILFAIAYLIYSRKLNFINVILYFAIMIIAAVYLDEFQKWLNEQLDYDYGIESNSGGLIFSIIMVVITIFSIFVIGQKKEKSPQAVGLINIGIIATIFWVLRIFTRVAERPSFYFLTFSFAGFAYAIYTLNNGKERGVVKVTAVFLCLALFIYRLMTSQSGFVPYRFFSF